MFSSLKKFVKSNEGLKKIAASLIYPKNDPRPRWWIRNIVNRFNRQVHRNCIIRRNARLDVVPFNSFKVGSYTIIEDFSTINNNLGYVEIEKNSIVGLGSTVIGPVSIGENVMIAQHVLIAGMNHGYQDVSAPSRFQPCNVSAVAIEDDVWIGANAIITAGVRIGKHAVVGAGSVVTAHVPPFSVVTGNPARVIKKYNDETKAWEKVALQ